VAGGNDRLKHCIRDLSALTALPSLCIGRTPEETFDILLDALPTALSCDLVYFTLPPDLERAVLQRRRTTAEELAQIRTVVDGSPDGAESAVFLGGLSLSCIDAEIPLGARRGRLVAGRRSQLDSETDRVLIRTAANLIGTIIETANVLETARRKDDFLAMLGHELRNPLAPIVTAVELLKLNPSVNRERDVIERHSQHLVRIVDDLLDISRVTRGHVELRREYVPLSSVLQRAVEIASPLMARNKHNLDVAESHDTILQGDPIRLAQIFGNLLTNAAKFTPPGGQISVLVGKSASRVTVMVRDSGVGIAKDQLQRIFEPFVQADRARDVLRGGLGLGLAIVRELVERHGGSISVHSDGRGKGSTFTVELPAVTQPRPQTPSIAPPPPEAREQIRVLVVDDNHDIADLLSEALEAQGFKTAIANDGKNALERWRSFAPHAGVLDVGLPDLDGYGVARLIRSEFGKSPVLIAVTGYGQPTDRLRSSDAGFDCHMVKPVSIQELIKVLDQRVVRAKSAVQSEPAQERD
jgi:signal transduction histidine kinase/CheY-like chemotaxis protein